MWGQPACQPALRGAIPVWSSNTAILNLSHSHKQIKDDTKQAAFCIATKEGMRASINAPLPAVVQLLQVALIHAGGI